MRWWVVLGEIIWWSAAGFTGFWTWRRWPGRAVNRKGDGA